MPALRVFLNNADNPDDNHDGEPAFGPGLFGPTYTETGWINLLITIVLLWILWKIPFWVLGSIRGRTGGSMLGSAVRAFAAYKTLGLLRGASTLLRHGRSSRRRINASGDGMDPYAAERATPDGQLLLPLPGLRRQRRRSSQPRASTPSTAPPTTAPAGSMAANSRRGRGRQLELPLDHDHVPEQLRLPIFTRRVQPPLNPTDSPATGPGTSAGRATRRPRPAGTQLELPLQDPLALVYGGNRPSHVTGQYPLPLGHLPRGRRPAPTPPMPPGPPPARRPRPRPAEQLELPLDDPPIDPRQNVRALHGGQYPLPHDGLTRRPRPTPPPAPPVAPRPSAPPPDAPPPVPPPPAPPPAPSPGSASPDSLGEGPPSPGASPPGEGGRRRPRRSPS